MTVRNLITVLLILLMAAMIGCNNEQSIQIPDRIILVTIDTLRADHLSLYGYPGINSPFIDSLGERSIVFEKAFSSTHFTLPSHISILTGLYPIVHGATSNARHYSGEYPTMAEYFQEKGYKTARFVSTGFLVPESIKGFDYSEYVAAGRNRGFQVSKAANKWLDENVAEDDKLFLWIHLFDPHNPYIPSDENLTNSTEQFKTNPRLFKAYWFDEQKKNKDMLLAYSAQKMDLYGGFRTMNDLMNRYDGEIMMADQSVQQIYEHLETLRVNGNSMWLITADHGENLGNHSQIGHENSAYNSLIHVPLLIHFPDHPGIAARIAEPVRHVDIFPTIIEFSGDEISQYLAIANGMSLRSVILDPTKSADLADEFVFAHRTRHNLNQSSNPEYVYKEHGYTYFWRPGNSDLLFSEEDDFYQTTNIIEQHPEIARTMRARVEKVVESLLAYASSSQITDDEEILQELRDLGYIQ